MPSYLIAADLAAMSRLYAMSLAAASLKYDDQSPSFAAALRCAAEEARRLANEYSEIALWHWAAREVQP